MTMHFDQYDTTRAGHRQMAHDADWCADTIVSQAEDNDTPTDWERVRYFQLTALTHALLALSVDDS